MKAFLTTCIVSGALLAGGCATKKYVRNTTAPIQAKVDQVGEQTSQNGQQITKTQSDLKEVDDKAQNGISAAQEKASGADQHAATADQHAGDAMNKANQADGKADRVMSDLRNVVANLDDYKLQTSATVPFKLNQYALSQAAKDDLDKLATDLQTDKRFFIAVEGYTDKTGTRQFNEALSRKRADAVVEYLVGKHDIPIYRVHMIGLADAKPVDEGHDREARAKNRRVEVKVFSADGLAASLETSDSANRTQDKH
ncbi:OmpA/MotB domain protein [Candidatus Sulfopaludibacter sp. SbA3]|nr:OmpA/MotB domain protein [Candidatus Sulfopaludibacter sp. SbA3]